MTGGRHGATRGWKAALSPYWRHRRVRLAIVIGVVAAVASGAAAFAVLSPLSDSQSSDAAGTPDPTIIVDSEPSQSVGALPGHSPETRARPPATFPDASTTGVPDGVSLTSSESLEVHDDGTVIENVLIVDGSIEIFADDVTVRNVRITNEGEFVQWGIYQAEGYQGLVVEDSEIFGGGGEQFASGISNYGGMMTVRRVEVHSITDGIVTSAGVVEDSYVHSPRYFEGDHTDMVQANGGPPEGERLEIRHNTLINTEDQTGAVSLFDNFRPVRNVVVEGNLLAGGGYTFYGGGLLDDGSTPANVVVRDNVFSRQVFQDSGFYGPVAYFDEGAPGNEWVGNVWEDDGAPVAVSG